MSKETADLYRAELAKYLPLHRELIGKGHCGTAAPVERMIAALMERLAEADTEQQPPRVEE